MALLLTTFFAWSGTARAQNEIDDDTGPHWAKTAITLRAGELDLEGSLGGAVVLPADGKTRFDLATPMPQGLARVRLGITDWLELENITPVWTIPSLHPAMPRVSLATGVAAVAFDSLNGFWTIPALRASVSWVSHNVAVTLEEACLCGVVGTRFMLPDFRLSTTGTVELRLNDDWSTRLTASWAKRVTDGSPPKIPSNGPASSERFAAALAARPALTITGPSIAWRIAPSVRAEVMPVVAAGLLEGRQATPLRVGAAVTISWTPKLY